MRLLVLLLLTLLVSVLPAQDSIHVQVKLRNPGTNAPVSGQQQVTLRVFDSAAGNNLIWGPWPASVTPDSSGVVSMVVGDSNRPLGAAVLQGQTKYLEIQIGSETLTPRLALLPQGPPGPQGVQGVQGEPGRDGQAWMGGVVSNPTTFNAAVTVNGSTSVNGTTTTSGPTVLGGTTTIASANVTGSTNLGGTTTMTGPTSLAGMTTMVNALITGSANLSGATTMAGPTALNGSTTIANANITGSTSLGGTTTMNGPANLNGQVTIASQSLPSLRINSPTPPPVLPALVPFSVDVVSATSGLQVQVGITYPNSSANVRGLSALVYAGSGEALGAFTNAESPAGSAIGGRFIADTYSAGGDVWGVQGYAGSTNSSTTSIGVLGRGDATSSVNSYGVKGIGTTYGVYASGNLGSSGQKSFIHPHPVDASKEVKFICLEGNENGCYFRGKASVVGGVATIPVPPEWAMVTVKDSSTTTVHLTPIRSFSLLATWEIMADRIEVRGTQDCEFTYMVVGVRRGFEKHEAISPNLAFRPEVAGIPFGCEYPRSYRDLLVENQILNHDYTPNVQTAARLGWKLRPATQDEIRQAVRAEESWQQRQQKGSKR